MKHKFLAIVIVVAALGVIFFLLGPLYVVNEGTQAVVTRFGEIVNTRTEAGLYVKIPVIDIVTVYPRLILSLDGDPQRIPTKENQFIIVDTTSRWRISDPKKFYQSFVTEEAAYTRLSDIIDSSVRTVITRNRLSEVVRSSNVINDRRTTEQYAITDEDVTAQIETLVNVTTTSEAVTKGRRLLSREMADEARKMVPEYGIELIDVLPRQIKYSDELTESVYNRMVKDRNQVAQAYRSLGEGKKADWQGKLENELLRIRSEAYRTSEEIKGKADAEATAIYAAAYLKDTEFYTFWKSMESYKKTLPKFDATYSTNMEYFRYLYAPNGRR
ncbi:MAG: protease modulator HflC [Spirochaetaceae bacterium]|jgi:membrane protease subunit HflC|nr:protease modulator HflC [Spirochaetaceae bacterium]